jgi:prepilin-type N-terminal cleavage/methylation domain-containing protein
MRRGRRGFTLAEVLLASTILAIVSAAATLPILAGEQYRQEADRLKHASELGRALMDEILARPVQSTQVPDTLLGPSAIETSREKFLNVDAFAGYSESDGVLRNHALGVINAADVSGMWRSVTVQYATYPGQMAGDTTGLLLVRVNVLKGNVTLASFSRLVAREGS